MTVSSTDPTRDEVVAWLRANGWRYSKGARHFGLDKEIVTAWGREARGLAEESRARATAAGDSPVTPPPPPDDRIQLSPLESIEWQMTEVLADIERLKDQTKNTTAISTLRRTYRELGKDRAAEVERLRLAGVRNDDEDNPATLIAELVALVAAAPEQVIEALVEAIDLRRNPPDRLE